MTQTPSLVLRTSSPPGGEGEGEGVRRALLFLIVLVAVGIRTIPFYSITFSGETTIFHDTDPYYHMRSAVYAASNGGGVPQADHYLLYPEGQPNFWPGLLERLIAVGAWIFSRSSAPSQALLEKVGAWISPILAGLTVLIVYALAKHLLNSTAALWVALVFAFQPTHLDYSKLGRPDHHVLEALTQILSLWLMLRTLRFQTVKDAIFLGVSFWLAYLSWSGATIYILPLLLAMGFSIFISVGAGPRARPELWILSLAVSIALLLWPCLSSWWGSQGLLSFKGLSLFHLGFLFSFLLAFLGAISLRRRTLGAAAGFLISGILFGIFMPDFFRQAWNGIVLLGKTENVWLTTIGEYQPMLLVDGKWIWQRGVAQMGPGFLFYIPGFLVWLVQSLRGKRDLSEMLALALWVFSLTNLALLQLRYGYALGGCVSFFSVFFFWNLYEFFKGRALSDFIVFKAEFPRMKKAWEQGRRWGLPLLAKIPRLTWRPGLCDAAVLAGAGFFWWGWKILRISLQISGVNPMLSVEDIRFFQNIHRVTPETSFYNEPTRKPEYGILSIWDMGHFISYLSKRPPVVNPHGEGVKHMVDFFLAKSEAEADAVMEKTNARYVLTGDPLPVVEGLRKISLRYPEQGWRMLSTEGPYLKIPKQEFLSLMGIALHLHDGTKPQIPDMDLPALSHYRLILESERFSELVYMGGPNTTARFKLFEKVKGARLTGFARPKESVGVALALRSNVGRVFIYQNWTVADAKGKFSFTLPYATTKSGHPTYALGRYQIFIGKKRYEARVKEEDVILGKAVKWRGV